MDDARLFWAMYCAAVAAQLTMLALFMGYRWYTGWAARQGAVLGQRTAGGMYQTREEVAAEVKRDIAAMQQGAAEYVTMPPPPPGYTYNTLAVAPPDPKGPYPHAYRMLDRSGVAYYMAAAMCAPAGVCPLCALELEPEAADIGEGEVIPAADVDALRVALAGLGARPAAHGGCKAPVAAAARALAALASHPPGDGGGHGVCCALATWVGQQLDQAQAPSPAPPGAPPTHGGPGGP